MTLDQWLIVQLVASHLCACPAPPPPPLPTEALRRPIPASAADSVADVGEWLH